MLLMDGDPSDPLDSVARADLALAEALLARSPPETSLICIGGFAGEIKQRADLGWLKPSDLILAGGSFAGASAAREKRGRLVFLAHTPGSPAKALDPEVAASYHPRGAAPLTPRLMGPRTEAKLRRVCEALSAAELVCCNSRWTAEVYRRVYGPMISRRLSICVEAVGVDTAAPLSQPIPGIPRLLSILRDRPRKRAEGIWAAAAALRARGLEHRWDLLCGRDEAAIRAQAPEGLNLHLHGLLKPPALEALFSQAWLYVHPARAEHLGLGILEALARGVPVVASRSGGPPTYLREGVEATLFEPDDWGDLTRAILEALEAPQRGRAGRQMVQARFSWGAAVGRLQAALEARP
ncbi:glycosyltransferase family 4 protein [Myxococcota bacterium]|nr:glycosyltransferase family 4 protein [Myxococcota bacterium]MBU1433099.1 glycosyltransferase family 4 protein [Myxococcota bacterium]MBU1897657.1 glycosyltransferase family 4 protein [Myxococcota bacterium]